MQILHWYHSRLSVCIVIFPLLSKKQVEVPYLTLKSLSDGRLWVFSKWSKVRMLLVGIMDLRQLRCAVQFCSTSFSMGSLSRCTSRSNSACSLAKSKASIENLCLGRLNSFSLDSPQVVWIPKRNAATRSWRAIPSIRPTLFHLIVFQLWKDIGVLPHKLQYEWV